MYYDYKIFSFYDLLLSPIYLAVILIIARYIYKKNRSQSHYKYFFNGLLVKLLGGVLLCCIYGFYYGGGDATGYHYSANSIINLLLVNPLPALDIIINGFSFESFSSFSLATGIPDYYHDKRTFFLVRLLTPIVLLGSQSFICSTLLLSALSYSGIWKLYVVFKEEFKTLEKELAIAVLFVPSVFFWGSGLLKDTVTISALGWYTFSFYKFLIKKNFNFKYGITLLLSAYLILAIKPYIFFAVIPGSVLWVSYNSVHNFKSKILRSIFIPIYVFVGIVGGFFLLNYMSGFLGEYSVDNVFERASIVQKDLKADYYEGHSFDIGDFDPSLEGGLRKAHLAIAATLFRPYLWDVKNVVMLLSALENTFILFLTIILLIRLKVLGFFSIILKSPLLFFSISFALFFAFSVGLATSNFGALVRLKIPCIPYFVGSLFVIKHFYEEKYKKAR